MDKSNKNQEDNLNAESNLHEEENPMEEIENTSEQENENEDSDNLADLLEKEKQQCQEYKDSYVRLMAEFDNYRKRTLREKSDLLKSAGESILTALLPIIDDFERALDVMKTSDDIEANKEGTRLIYEKLVSFLVSQGVSVIDASVGSDFNTEYDEAVTTIPAENEELKGKIVDCVQKGYMLNDKVIRFAKVVVGE